MVSAIICFICGFIWYMIASQATINSAVQETVQFILCVNGSIFTVAGFILLKMNKIQQAIKNTGEEVKPLEVSSGNIGASFKNIDDETLKMNGLTKICEEPDKNSKFVCNLLKGEIVTLLEKREVGNVIWYNVIDKKNTKGWFF